MRLPSFFSAPEKLGLGPLDSISYAPVLYGLIYLIILVPELYLAISAIFVLLRPTIQLISKIGYRIYPNGSAVSNRVVPLPL